MDFLDPKKLGGTSSPKVRGSLLSQLLPRATSSLALKAKRAGAIVVKLLI